MFKKKGKIREYSATRRRTTKIKSQLEIRRKKEIISKSKKILKIIVVLGILLAIFYTVFYSKIFRLENLEIKSSGFEDEDIVEAIEATLQKQIGINLLSIDTEELESQLQLKIKQLQTIEVEKDYPNNLLIKFEKYPLAANIIHESENMRKSYIVNSIGFPIKEDFQDPNLPVIKIISNEPINTDSSIINPEALNYITEATKSFEEKFGIKVTEAQYKKIPRELHLLTEKNFYVWLDIQISSEQQFKKLKKALVKIDIHNQPLEYIDLRISGKNGEKVIYKPL